MAWVPPGLGYSLRLQAALAPVHAGMAAGARQASNSSSLLPFLTSHWASILIQENGIPLTERFSDPELLRYASACGLLTVRAGGGLGRWRAAGDSAF